jgi:RNA polymerase sigma factor (sigma-70 family)
MHIGATGPAPSASALFPFAGPSGMQGRMNRGASHSQAGEELAGVLEAVARGDRQAFARLYERTSAKLYGICLRLLGNEAEAEDVLQDVYVTVWQKAERFDRGRASPITWLAVLARNKGIDRLRRRATKAEPIEAAADIEDDSPLPFELVRQRQEAGRLSDCLEELDERPRAMIRAAFLDGATYPELAEREGVPLGTMKSWIRRAMQRLRGCLER